MLCQHGDRRVAGSRRTGKFTTLADKYEGKRLNSPNDLVFKSNGDLYFTDPPYGLPKAATTRRRNSTSRASTARRRRQVTLLTKEMNAPNGIAFSPDEKTLYVAKSDPDKAIWMAFPVKADGTLGEGRVFVDATADGEGEASRRCPTA